jgi:hypothetical protein
MPFFTTSITNNGAGRFETPVSQNITLYNVSGQTLTFNNCGATGRFGPTLAQCQTQYGTTTPQSGYSTWGTDSNLFFVNYGVQFWRVPATGSYTITTAGASAGPQGQHGRGAIISKAFSLRAGDILRIVVGQQGGFNGTYGGGGGASCVARVFFQSGGLQLLILAGGGAGVTQNENSSGNRTNRDARNTTETYPLGGYGSFYENGYPVNDLPGYWGGGGGGSWAVDGDRGGIGTWRYGRIANEGKALSSICPYGGESEAGWHGGFGGGGGSGRDGGAAGGGGGWRGGNAHVATSTTYEDTSIRGGSCYALGGYTGGSFGASGRDGQGYVTIACP